MRKTNFICMVATILMLTEPTQTIAANAECKTASLDALRQYVPEGYRIYREVSDKSQFTSWFGCKDIILDLATGVHESVHVITEEQDIFPLIDGVSIERPHTVSAFTPPKVIAPAAATIFGNDDIFIQTYLKPGETAASSSDDFLYLLDELNAFSHDLNVATKLALNLAASQNGQVDHRDGLAAMMAFVAEYVDFVSRNDQASWRGLQNKDTRSVLRALWGQGETVLAASCGIPDFGSTDRSYIQYFCATENNKAISQILGRSPVCPSKCAIGQ
ncbi:hypothetical protein F9K84_21495 [Brucella anthropi]|uniref:hypothetical protein n=1 Tax=Brucella anthropi TaxID=529 RepID=UPI00124DBFB2|nr:hypothetical protein [Brucella anthropi]KAB2766108.1 hypothetical protein F9K84_21495 [Brucella anthropi]